MRATPFTTPSSSSIPSSSIDRALKFVAVSVLVLGTVDASAAKKADIYYRPGFEMKLPKESAGQGYRGVVQVGTTVIAQVGGHYLTAVNEESGSERWRFESPSGSIRKLHARGEWLLVEAEDLVALDAVSGRERWRFPLNCYEGGACNSRIRVLREDMAVLTGFDGKDDHVMLVDPRTGQRVWPNWVPTGPIAHIRATPSEIVVALAGDPWAILGVDRYTGRERWRFRPDGTEGPAAGLIADALMVNAWWTSKRADEVYAIDVKTGEARGDWMVARRASSDDEARGGGPGFFYAYQPSVLGGGGTARAWRSSDGEKLWRRRIRVDFAPELRGGRLYAWANVDDRTVFVAYDAMTGDEAWRYERPNIDARDETYEGPTILIRMIGDTPFFLLLGARNGAVLGIGPLADEALHTAILQRSGKYVFALTDRRLVRFEPVRGRDLIFKFDSFVKDALMDDAKKLHEELRPFVDELAAAAEINRRVVSRDYRSQQSSMKTGSFSALLPIILKQAQDDELLYYQDFREFAVQTRKLLEPHADVKTVKGRDRERLASICQRLVALMERFERKLTDKDKETVDALLQVVVRLAGVLLASGDAETAHTTVFTVYERGWVEHTDGFLALVKKAVRARLGELLPPFRKAVAKRVNQDATALDLLMLGGLDLVLEEPPGPEQIPDMTDDDYTALLVRLLDATNAR